MTGIEMHTSYRYYRHVHIVLGLLLSIIMAFLFIAERRVGIADNGDFTRVANIFVDRPQNMPLNWPDSSSELFKERFFSYFIPQWHISVHPHRPASTAQFLWIPGIMLNYVIKSTSVLNLWIMSIPPRLMIIAGLWLLLGWIRKAAANPLQLYTVSILLGTAYVLVFTTVDYASIFNSFCQESASIFFLITTIACVFYVQGSPTSRLSMGLLIVSCLALSGAKSSLLYMPLVWIPLSALIVRKKNPWKRLAASFAVGALCCAAGFIMTYRTDLILVNGFNGIFDGTLTFSHFPQKQLASIGLQDGRDLIGHHGHSPEGASYLKTHEKQVGLGKDIVLFLHEPFLPLRMLNFAAAQMQDISLAYLGKRARGDPLWRAPLAISQNRDCRQWVPPAPVSLNIWSALKFRYFPTGTLFFVFLGAFCAIAVYIIAKTQENLPRVLSFIALACAICCCMDLFIAIAGNGRFELVKHLLVTNLLFDLSFVTLFASMVSIGLNLMASAFPTLIRYRDNSPDVV
jgi:hypothetical protein